MWWVVSILLTVSLSCYLNYRVRIYDDIFDIGLIKYLPLVVFINYLYWYSYKNCSSYFICSLVCLIMLALISSIIDVFILKEIEYNTYNKIGIIFIIIGVILIYWRN